MVTSVTQGETKTELWHQCNVAEPKRWALWDEEGGLWTWGGTKSPRTSSCHLDLTCVPCLEVWFMVSNPVCPTKCGATALAGHNI